MGKKIPMWQCLIVMLAMVGLLVWSIVRDSGGEPHIALILAAVVAGLVAWANGWKWAYLEQGILASINRSMQAILILGILGCLIASWMAAGTIPSMMYYGIKVISPKVFLLTACILCSIVSLATGSSWSTAGSMGVALIGVGTALGFPEAMTAGAVVSGAYFGDKIVPSVRYYKPGSCNGRRYPVRSYQTHDLHYRYIYDNSFGCLCCYGLHVLQGQRCRYGSC